jgi:hypothetical protein
MSLNYNEPDSASQVTAALEENPSITTATLAAITTVLGNPTPDTPIVVGSWDGTGAVVAPEGQATQIVVVDIAGEDPVEVAIPSELATNPVWVFDTDADVTVRFNTVERVIQMGNGSDDVVVAGDKDTTIDGAGGNDLIETSGGNDSITGGNGNDTINAGDGNDTISGVLNFDTIDGGAGFDVLMLQGAFADWTVSLAGSAVVFNSTTATGASAGAPSNAQVSNVELVQIAQEAAELTQFSYAILPEEGNAADAMRLYQTALGRSADIEGAQFWLDAIENGATVQQLATDFAGSTEFSTIWSAVSTNTELVTQIYQNAFGEAPDQAGLDFWVTALDDGLSTGDFIAQIAMTDRAATDITNVIVVGDIV